MQNKALTLLTVTALVGFAVNSLCAQPPGGGRRGFMRMLPVMSALDADEDGEISANELENATTALKALDRDNNGKLTEEELRPDFGRAGGRGPGGRGGFGGRRPSPEAQVERYMRLDQNNDGKLSKDELGERFESVLARADEDKDGFASRDELMKVVVESANSRQPGRGGFGGPGGFRGPGGFGGRPNPEQFVERAFQFDEDKDGKLSKEEVGKMAEQFGRRFGGGFGRSRGESGRPRRPPSE